MDCKEESEDGGTTQKAVGKVQAKLGELQVKSVVMEQKSWIWILTGVLFPQKGAAGWK